MSLFVVDVETDGPVPGLYSMISFGAVLVEKDKSGELDKTFYGQIAPLPGASRDETAAKISGISRLVHESYEAPSVVMPRFASWIAEVNRNSRPVFVSDNPAFDWQFINYYFILTTGSNPFGFSARRIGDFYCGLKRDYFASWKHLRETTHDHNPVNDAKGNAEALIKMAAEFEVGLPR